MPETGIRIGLNVEGERDFDFPRLYFLQSAQSLSGTVSSHHVLMGGGELLLDWLDPL